MGGRNGKGHKTFELVLGRNEEKVRVRVSHMSLDIPNGYSLKAICLSRTAHLIKGG